MAKKLTKAQCRKRLNEASDKIFRVFYSTGMRDGLTPADLKQLYDMRVKLQKYAEKMR